MHFLLFLCLLPYAVHAQNGLSVVCNGAEAIQRDVNQAGSFLGQNARGIGRIVFNVTQFLANSTMGAVARGSRFFGNVLRFPFTGLGRRNGQNPAQSANPFLGRKRRAYN